MTSSNQFVIIPLVISWEVNMKTTTKLVKILRENNNHELARAVLDLHNAMVRWERNVQLLSGEYDVCPTCKRKLTDSIDRDFFKHAGECLGCDHVRGEVDGIMMMEAMDYMYEEQVSREGGEIDG